MKSNIPSGTIHGSKYPFKHCIAIAFLANSQATGNVGEITESRTKDDINLVYKACQGKIRRPIQTLSGLREIRSVFHAWIKLNLRSEDMNSINWSRKMTRQSPGVLHDSFFPGFE